jgi:hypothetical protein
VHPLQPCGCALHTCIQQCMGPVTSTGLQVKDNLPGSRCWLTTPCAWWCAPPLDMVVGGMTLNACS